MTKTIGSNVNFESQKIRSELYGSIQLFTKLKW